METKNDILLNENQYRLLMCGRIARALGKGEVYLDLTGPKMCWRVGKEDCSNHAFYSIDEMESYLEHLLENRCKLNSNLRNMNSSVKRRVRVIQERNKFQATGNPMTFPSRINWYGK